MPILLLFVVAAVVLLSSRTALAYVQGKPVEISLGSIGGGFSLSVPAAAAFNAMAKAAAAAGVTLEVQSAFRTNEQQELLYAKFKAGTGNLAAEPGWSNHQNGIAVDLAVQKSFTSPTYLWLKANAWKFGFVNTGATFSQPEPWHWEYRP